jgi:hypothetical protein
MIEISERLRPMLITPLGYQMGDSPELTSFAASGSFVPFVQNRSKRLLFGFF